MKCNSEFNLNNITINFIPEEVLYWYDGPMIFTTRNSDHTLLLAYQMEELDDGQRFLVAPTTIETVQGLKENKVDVRDALLQGSSLWIVDTDMSNVPTNIYNVQDAPELLPVDSLPKPGTLLYPS
jgi:hypothetical protein